MRIKTKYWIIKGDLNQSPCFYLCEIERGRIYV